MSRSTYVLQFLHYSMKHPLIRLPQSTDPFQKPNVHVGYLNVDFDLQVLVAGAQAVRKVISIPPLRCYSLFFSHDTSLTIQKRSHRERNNPWIGHCPRRRWPRSRRCLAQVHNGEFRPYLPSARNSCYAAARAEWYARLSCFPRYRFVIIGWQVLWMNDSKCTARRTSASSTGP